MRGLNELRGLTTSRIRSITLFIALSLFSFVIFTRIYTSAPPRGLTVAQRMAASELAWSRKVRERLRVIQMSGASSDFPLYSALRLPNYPGGAPYYHIWDFFTPSYTCPWVMERVGRFADGGKWLCGYEKPVHRPANARQLVVYSFGVEQDSAFEAQLLTETNAKVYGYDPTVDGFGDQMLSKWRGRTEFGKLGLSGVDEPQKSPPFYTLKTLMIRANTTYIDVLKMDIEGAEFDSLEKFFFDYEGEHLPIGQLLVELHLYDDTEVDFGRLTRFWAQLEAFGMRQVSYEPNLLQVIMDNPLPGGGRQPRCAEVVWVNVNDPHSLLWID